MSNLLNHIDSYNSWQEPCDTDCDTFLRPEILGILLLKSHPRTHRNLTTSKKGTKGSVVVAGVLVVDADCSNNAPNPSLG